jgi:hypothetical protein
MPTTLSATSAGATGGGTNTASTGTGRTGAKKKCIVKCFEEDIEIGNSKFNVNLIFDATDTSLVKDVNNTSIDGISPCCIFLGSWAKNGLVGNGDEKSRIHKLIDNGMFDY